MNGGVRKAHYLKSNKSLSWPTRFIFFDTETIERPLNENEKELHLLFGVALFVSLARKKCSYKEEELVFTSGEELANFIEKHAKKKTCLYIFAANIAFDLRTTNLIHHLRKRGWEIEYPIMRNKVFFTKAKKDGYGKLRFIDALNYGVNSVAEMGKIVGLEKLEMPQTQEITDEFIAYCRRDVEIIKRFILTLRQLCKEENLCSFAPTLASLAFKTFRHRFMNTKVLIHNNEAALKLEREGYHGGRTECFWLGKFDNDTYYKLDVNSMYPFVMFNYDFPTILRGYAKDISLSSLQYALKHYYVIAKVHIKSDSELFPVIIDKRLCYVKGDFITVLHHAELMRALEHRCITKVYEIAFYEKRKLFKEYVEYFYAKRLEAKDTGNVLLANIYKLFLNSLYGKFGQKGYKREVEKVCDSDAISCEEIIHLGTGQKFYVINWFGTLIYESEKGEGMNSAPAIAGAVTAYAREYLTKLIKIAGEENVFYCDTDSLIVNKTGYENLANCIDQRELGKLKIEGITNMIIINGLKNYVFGNEWRLKGIKKSAEQIAEDTFLQEEFEGFKSAVKEGRTEGVKVKKKIKQLKKQYKKGIVCANGRILPFELAPLL